MTLHNHPDRDTKSSGLTISLIVTCIMMILEFVAGLLSNSLALMSDSGHMLADALALGASLFALKLARKPATKKHTYGYLRAEILVALFNGATLLAISFFVFYKAYTRFFNPPEIKATLMLAVAIIGLFANLAGIKLLQGSISENLNIRSAFWHMLGDAISSAGVIIAGVVILATGWNPVDSIISILIGIIILKGAWGVVKESTNILLESVPGDIDMESLSTAVKKIDGIRDFHDIHVWTISSGSYALSAHLLVYDQMVSKSRQIVELTVNLLAQKYGISHTTLQLECEGCDSKFNCSLENGKHFVSKDTKESRKK